MIVEVEMNKLVDKGFKFRIYPNNDQKIKFSQIFGCCRFVYNHYLAQSQEDYKQGRKFKSTYDNQKDLTLLKKDSNLDFLKEADSQALNQAIVDLGVAYDRFFKKISDRPKFKKKSNNQSYTTFVTSKNSSQLLIQEDKINIPKVGWVKIKQHRPVEGRITSGTISKTCSGKYFISLHCTDCPVESFDKTNSEVGLDLGLQSLITFNDGSKVSNPHHIKKSLSKLEKEQQKLSNKTVGSNNWQKQRIKVACLHEKVVNQRKDFTHKLTHDLVKNHDFIAAEDLDVKSMLESEFDQLTKDQLRAFHRNITDVSWSELLRQLSYKSEWYGKTFVQVNQFFPSSQLCSCCGYKNPLVKDLKVRKWICPSCRSTHDRDKNAAINILAEGRNLTT